MADPNNLNTNVWEITVLPFLEQANLYNIIYQNVPFFEEAALLGFDATSAAANLAGIRSRWPSTSGLHRRLNP